MYNYNPFQNLVIKLFIKIEGKRVENNELREGRHELVKHI